MKRPTTAPIVSFALACGLLLLHPLRVHACHQRAEVRSFSRELTHAVRCQNRRLRWAAERACPPPRPPACTGTLVGDTLRLAYGPDAARLVVSGDRVAPQLTCQRRIGRAVARFVTTDLALRGNGIGRRQAEASARRVLARLLRRCDIAVRPAATGSAVPAVGPQCAAAVGAPGSGVDVAALEGCLTSFLATWVDEVAPRKVRPFRMGFSIIPGGPPGGPMNDLQRTIDIVDAEGDVALVQLEQHIPWGALAAGDTTTPRGLLQMLRGSLAPGVPVYAMVSPLNVTRNGVGGDVPAALGPACLSNPRLRTAFRDYVRMVVDVLQPDFLGVGAEVNLYQGRSAPACPDDFTQLVSLYKEVYHDVKATRPALPVFPSFQLDLLRFKGERSLPAIFAPELDRLALSTYPAGSPPDEIPPDYISWARASTDAPLVIAETGYPSDPAPGTSWSPEEQSQYLMWLLGQADRQQADFVIWTFSSDPGWISPPAGGDPRAADLTVFRSQGLMTGGFVSKPAFGVWQEFLARRLLLAPTRSLIPGG